MVNNRFIAKTITEQEMLPPKEGEVIKIDDERQNNTRGPATNLEGTPHH
jgi:hypothetical protein